LLTSYLEVNQRPCRTPRRHNYQILEKFLVPELQWVIATMPYAHILSQG